MGNVILLLFLIVAITQGQNLVVPGGNNPPNQSALCQNYSIYLQAPPGATTPSILWRCIRRHWMMEVAGNVDRSNAVGGQSKVSISKPNYVPSTLQVFRNGLLQDLSDYIVNGTTVTFISALGSGDKIALVYLYI